MSLDIQINYHKRQPVRLLHSGMIVRRFCMQNSRNFLSVTQPERGRLTLRN